jgi:allophanate hydrolase subunit 2
MGGYPVLAVVIRADWGSLAARRPGATVRFRAVGLDEARELWSRLAPASGERA